MGFPWQLWIKKIVFFSSRTAFPWFFLISFCPDLIFTKNYESYLSKYESSEIECCRFISSLFFFYGHLVMLMWFLTSHRNETRGRNTPESVSINQHSIFVLSLKLSSVKSGIIYNITDFTLCDLQSWQVTRNVGWLLTSKQIISILFN